ADTLPALNGLLARPGVELAAPVWVPHSVYLCLMHRWLTFTPVAATIWRSGGHCFEALALPGRTQLPMALVLRGLTDGAWPFAGVEQGTPPLILAALAGRCTRAVPGRQSLPTGARSRACGRDEPPR